MTASTGAKWRVRVAVAFPDVFHEKRALQMLADIVSMHFVARGEAKAAAKAAALTAAEAAAKAAAEAEAAANAKWKLVLQSNSWEEAFDSHIACSLEECGYPRRQAKVSSYDYTPSPAPVRTHGVPPPAALTLLQTKARDRILAYALQKLGPEHMTSDVVIYVDLCDGNNAGYDNHRMVIRLDNKRFPHNATHFRTAGHTYALGIRLHQCFVPSSQSPGTRLPFVTVHHVQHGPSCAKSPITLPDTDIVYGEYTAPAASENVTYPVGTVLMYPREVVPREITTVHGACDSPWFIVFKPCAATLLNGAVPVGRVMSCVQGKTASTSDNSAQPFDARALQRFETYTSPQPGQ